MALATRLAGEGATVIAHARSEERGRETLAELLDGPGDVRLVVGDLASLSAVRALADQVPDRLDVLVNNAGIGFAGGREESDDGYELRFAVNYLAGFLLAALLRDRLVASAPARIVNVASAGQAAIDFDDVMLERRLRRRARVLPEQARADHARVRPGRGAARRAGVTATALHPATYMPTKMVTDAGVTPASTVEEGLEATWRLVADPALDGVSGAYFNGTSEARADPQAYDLDARRRLRELSQRLVEV